MATLRRCNGSCCAGNSRARFTNVQRLRTTFEDGGSEVAVSTVDLLMNDTDAFIQQKQPCYSYGSNGLIGGNMNKAGMWESIIDELEETCVSKIERPESSGPHLETVYKVPVVGFKQFTPSTEDEDYMLGAYRSYQADEQYDSFANLKKSAVKKIKRNPAKFMFWEGKYYDTSLIYDFQPERSNSLKAIGPLDAATPSLSGAQGIAEFTKNLSCHNAQHRRDHQFSRIHHRDLSSSTSAPQQQVHHLRGWMQRGAEDYLEINLHYPRFVTHIGTAGEYPQMTTFPTRRLVGKRRMRSFRASAEENDPLLSQRGNGIQQHKFAPYIRVLKEEESALAWVTSYEVHYRHHLTNKWTLLAVTAANSEALSEAVLDLRPYFNMREGLFTQYLRVRPLTHHLRPVMRVSVYGLDPKHVPRQAEPRSGAALGTLISSRFASLAEDEAGEQEESVAEVDEEVATIEYTVVASSSRCQCRYVRDGLRSYNMKYKWWYDATSDRKALKNKEWHATIMESRTQAEA